MGNALARLLSHLQAGEGHAHRHWISPKTRRVLAKCIRDNKVFGAAERTEGNADPPSCNSRFVPTGNLIPISLCKRSHSSPLPATPNLKVFLLPALGHQRRLSKCPLLGPDTKRGKCMLRKKAIGFVCGSRLPVFPRWLCSYFLRLLSGREPAWG